MALRPLLVTRSEVVKILGRLPREVLMGTEGGRGAAEHLLHRELLGALFGSIACIARPCNAGEGERVAPKALCLGEGFTYGDEEYAISSSVKTKLMITVLVLEGAPSEMGARGNIAGIREVSGSDDEEDYQERLDSVPPLVEPKTAAIRVTEVAARELFLAELLLMEPALRAGAAHRLTGLAALKRRRRTLRHVADAMKALRSSKKAKR